MAIPEEFQCEMEEILNNSGFLDELVLGMNWVMS